MCRLLLALLLASALLTSYALADDDWDGQSNVIRAEAAHPADSDKPAARDTHAAPPAAAPTKATLGSFLGAGEQFTESGVPDSTGLDGEPQSGHGQTSADVPSAQDEGEVKLSVGEEGDLGYLTENVYGPLWGVPDEAQGLDEFRSARSEYQREHGIAPHEHSQAAPAGEDAEPAAKVAEPAPQNGGAGDSAEQNGRQRRGGGLEKHTINRGDPNDW